MTPVEGVAVGVGVLVAVAGRRGRMGRGAGRRAGGGGCRRRRAGAAPDAAGAVHHDHVVHVVDHRSIMSASGGGDLLPGKAVGGAHQKAVALAHLLNRDQAR